MLGGITVYAEESPEGESEQPESAPPADDKNNAALEGLVKVMKPVAVCGIITGALAVSVAHPTTTPLMAVGAKVAVDAVLGFEVKKPNPEANTDGAEVEQLPATEETDEQAAVPEVIEEDVHAHLLKEIPDGLPLPNVPRRPSWCSIGWGFLTKQSMFDMIWARWFPPEASNYAGVVRPCSEPAGLGEVNDEELNRLDEAIKSSALGGKEYVKFAYLCEMLPEPIRKYRKMIHEFIPEVIEQGYGKEKESLHVGGFIGALLGFKTGLVDDLPRNLCRDALELLFDPLGTVCDIIDSVMPNNPDNCVAQIMRAWQFGDDFSRGRIVGNITGQVAIIVASKKFSAKVASGRAIEAASAASEVGSAAGVAEAASVAKEAQSAARVAKSAEAVSKVASVAKGAETASKAASVAKEAQSAASVAKGAEAVAKNAAGAAKEAETVAKGTKAAGGAGTAAKEAKGAETVVEATKEASATSGAATVAKTETVVERVNKNGRYYNGKYTGGRTQVELDDLARDPSHAFRIEEQGIKERQIGLELEERSKLGHIIRDIQENNGAEFIDTTTGVKWDVKSFESYPNGHTEPRKGAFTVSNAMKKLNSEFNKNHNVIIDVRELVPEHIDALKKAIEEVGVSDRIIWYP